MPTNKNALLRYKVLDRCFSDFNNKYDIQDLIDKVNHSLYDLCGKEVGLRQIRDDIKYMRDRLTYNAPIRAYAYQGKKCYYRYERRDFSIFNKELTLEDVSKLSSTIEMLAKYRGVANNIWLEEVISNLEYRFGIKTNTENVVAFDHNEQLRGLEFLSSLIDAAVNHQPLRIVYRSYKGTEKSSIVHPYHLKQFNNRWFLLGLEESTQWGNHITNMALDRIAGFSILADVTFIPNGDIDFTTYFHDVVGVTIPEDHPHAEEVLLRFHPARFPYVVSKPIHHTQHIVSEETRTLALFLRPNKELEAQILSYGNQVEVLQPLWLRQQIAEKIAESYHLYHPVHKDSTDNL